VLKPIFAMLSATVLCAAPALAQERPTVFATSPDGTLAVSVTTDGDGRAAYSVTRKGKPVIAPSKLGFLFTDVRKIDRGLAIDGQETRDFDETWTQPWGEWTSIRNRYRELKVRLKESSALARVFTVTFRIYDDGVGFRYEFPAQPNLAQTRIADELTEFAFAQDGTAWWKPAYLWNREEYLYNKTGLSSVSTAATPITIKPADGPHVPPHEAALVVPFPSEWQGGPGFSAGIAASSTHVAAARGFIRFLASPSAASAIVKSGMEPIVAR